ncbi:MAG: MFS transporter [Lactobacillaceae bacterium]|jgi:EmrB/QacA subfamily drug resistance transporter|nr:MFS transporter [Lactobacillaceae bacterium]
MKNNQNTENSTSFWWSMVSLGMFTFMSTLDGSIVNIALPVLSKQLDIPMNEATWTVSIYLIGISGLLTFFGNLGDQIGKIKVFRWGTVIFTIGSLLAGINQGLYFLLAARFVQAVGAAMTMSNSFGITTALAPEHMRARAMAFISAFVSLGSITGPSLGGIILQNFSWSYIFWINVPLGIIAIVIGKFCFPKSATRDEKLVIDWIGAITLFVFVVAVFVGLNIAQVSGFSNVWTILFIVGGIASFVGFIYQELHTPKPLLNLSIFKSKLFSISVVAATLVFTTTAFINTLLPFYLEDLRAIPAGSAGLYMLFWPIAMLLFAPVSGVVADKFDRENVTLFGLTMIMISLFTWIFVDAHTPMYFVAALLAFSGAGMAFFQTPNNALIMSNAPKKLLGVAGSVNALARNLGIIIGTTLVTSVLYVAMSNYIGYHITSYPKNNPSIFVDGMHVSFIVAGVIVVITFGLTLYRVIMRIKANNK